MDDDLTCHEVVELVTAYLEGELSPSEAARVEAHLEDCDGCRTVFEEFRATIRLTGMVREEELTATQRQTLLEAFRGWTAEPSSS